MTKEEKIIFIELTKVLKNIEKLLLMVTYPMYIMEGSRPDIFITKPHCDYTGDPPPKPTQTI